MRLAILNPVREYGGGEKWALDTASGLRQRGHDVTLCCHPHGELLRRAAAAGIPGRPALLRHDLSLPSVLRLAALWRDLRPDLILACTQRAVRLAAWSRWLNRHVALVYRNGLEGSFKDKPYNRAIFRRVDRIVTNAAATRNELLAFGWIPPSRLSMLYNGVAIPAPDPHAAAARRAALQVPPDTMLLLSVGRLVADKGHDPLLHALAALATRHSPLAARWRLLIAGEGPRLDDLRAERDRLGLTDCVRFLGFRTDIDALYQAADLVVHPSLREGAPNVALEAMAHGRAIIATDVAGSRELVGDAGLLVPPGDADALCGALAALLGDPARRRALADAARARAAECFSLQRSLDAWEQLLLDVIAGRAADSQPTDARRAGAIAP